MRGGVLQTSPYVVDKEMVDKYGLKNKFADFFFSPTKVNMQMFLPENNYRWITLSF